MNQQITIGILSDTHGLLRPRVLEKLMGVDHIIHAGDIGAESIIKSLQEIAPLSIVRGNNDNSFWAQEIPYTILTEIHGYTFYIVHADEWIDLDLQAAKVQFLITGHTHKAQVSTHQSRTDINPGSCGPRRFNNPVTMALLKIGDGKSTVEVFEVE